MGRLCRDEDGGDEDVMAMGCEAKGWNRECAVSADEAATLWE